MMKKNKPNIPEFSLKENCFYLFSKRTIDIFVSAIALVVIFPLLFLVVAFVHLLSPSHHYPVFFRQKRTGIYGNTFYCYKFRSMKASSLTAKTDRSRVSRFGLFMRKYSIDEVPQFFNVLIGDMSLVGPRPHMLRHTLQYSKLVANYEMRHQVKPGLTGYAQIMGYRGELKELHQMENRIVCDLWYIENRTLVMDLKIIFLTPVSIFKKIKPFK